MEYFDPPPIRYMGAKWQLADWLISLMPPHNIYVEPFCGSAAVFFRKWPCPLEILNDLNGDIVHFFRTLREHSQDLIAAIELTPFAYEEYRLSWESCEEPIERARRFYVRSWQSFSGATAKSGGWRRQKTNNRGTTPAHDWKRLDGLYKAVTRLKDAQIDSQDALTIIQRHDTPKTLFYCDPPYLMNTRKSQGKTNQYELEMSETDHRELAESLHNIRGMVVLSGYDSSLYRELYADWRIASKTTTTNGNGTAVEFVWISPRTADLNQLPLFATFEAVSP